MLLPAANVVWDKVLTRLRTNGDAYAVSQLVDLVPLTLVDQVLALGVKDLFRRDFVEEHFAPLVKETVVQLFGVTVTLAWEIVAAPVSSYTSTPTPVPQHRPAPRLDPRFHFETYVVGESNELVAAAAHAVSEKPGKSYNPLFIYGGTGLGKTHLLHAVGNRILERDPHARVLYLSCEEFTNQYIDGLRRNSMPEFRSRFRDECDVLLIDDVQFLGKKQETQNEFFYTFNALYQQSKAIVLTSDTVPSEIPGLEERLRSRFTMGLSTDVHEPNFEMRVAILKKKAEIEGLDLPDNVAQYIARYVTRNVRELEGALIKVSAVHSLTRKPITEEFAAQVLKDHLPAQKQIDADLIQKEVARYYKVPVEELRGKRRTQEIAHARHVAIYLVRSITLESYPKIGERFDKDHSTIITSDQKITALRETDETLRRELTELQQRLGVV